MPLEYRVEPDLLVVVAKEEYDFAEVRDVFERAIRDPALRKPASVLIDARDSRQNPPVSEMEATARFAHGLRPSIGPRIAVVVSGSLRYGLGRMLALLTEPSGYDMQVFRDLDAADAWIRKGGS